MIHSSSVLEMFFCSCESPQYRIQSKEALVKTTELHENSHVTLFCIPVLQFE